jgi:very-short-patch-repair endonuclease
VKESNIERKVRIELTKRKIKYQQEYPVRIGKRKWCYHLDFFIPELNLDIEADGAYWHTLNDAKKRDERKDKRLNKQNIIVVRLSEAEILEDVSKAVDRAIDFAKSKG